MHGLYRLSDAAIPAAHGAAGSGGSGITPTIVCVVTYLLLLVVFAVVCVRWASRTDDEDTEPGGGGGGPGPGPGGGGPDGPRHPGGGFEWWPEFERQFAAYIEYREGSREQPCVV
jgi:hypothetical protein